MVQKEIRWSKRDIYDKLDIYEYWSNRNKNLHYCYKLEQQFDHSVFQLSLFPESGKITDYKNVRVKPVKKYLIFYRITSDAIEVLRLWDTNKDLEYLQLPND